MSVPPSYFFSGQSGQQAYGPYPFVEAPVAPRHFVLVPVYFYRPVPLPALFPVQTSLLSLDPQSAVSLEDQRRGVKEDPKNFAIVVSEILRGIQTYPQGIGQNKKYLCKNVGRECPNWHTCPYAHSLAAWAAFNVAANDRFKTTFCRHLPCQKGEEKCDKYHLGGLRRIAKNGPFDYWKIHESREDSPLEQCNQTVESVAEYVLKDE